MTRRVLALLLVLASITSGCALLPGSTAYEVTAELTRSYNLFPGSPVRVLGVDVGRITDLRVAPGSATVEVVMRVDADVRIPADASAVVVPESLLGERYVQLPAYTGGPALEAGSTIPVERTAVPHEFDEVLEGLNDFVGGLDGAEVGRLVDNLAEVLDGQGEQLGRTIDQAHEAIGALRDNDEELVALAGRLADLNTTLATRDQQLARVIQDFDTLARSLADDAVDLDAALRGLVSLTSELDGLLATNADRLEQDIATLTRVGRTAQRNLDNISLAVLGSAELFRHAERIIDRERNMLPLQDQLFALAPVLTESVIYRLQALCLQAGLPDETCALDLITGLLGGLICAPPVVPCTGELEAAVPIDQALVDLITGHEELGAVVLDTLTRNAERRVQREDDAPDGAQDDVTQDEASTDAPAGDEPGRGLLDGLSRLLGASQEGP